MTQNPTFNITLDRTLPIVCEECQNETFNNITFLREVSKFITGTEQDTLIPIQTFACTKCGHINERFLLKNLGI